MLSDLFMMIFFHFLSFCEIRERKKNFYLSFKMRKNDFKSGERKKGKNSMFEKM